MSAASRPSPIWSTPIGNYVGGAFISGLNREMRERLWEQGSLEMEALAAELVRLHQTGLVEEEKLLEASTAQSPQGKARMS